MLGFVVEASKKYLRKKSYACFSGILEDNSNFMWYQEIPDYSGFVKTTQEDKECHPTLKTLWNDNVKPNYKYLNYREMNIESNDDQNKIFENKVNQPLLWLSQNVGVSLKFLEKPACIKDNLQIFINPKISSSMYIPQLSTISIDIEVGMKSPDILDAANNALYCIAIDSCHQSKVLMLDESITTPTTENLDEFEYKTFPDEKSLLQEFISCISQDSGQIFLGWSILEFDLQFLCKKIQLYGLDLRLGILGRKSHFSVSGNKDFKFYPGGRSVLDGIWLLKDMQIKLPNYKLDTAAEILINQRKTIVATDLQKLEEIDHLFNHDKKSLAIYNFQDAILPTKILEKIDGLPFFISKSILAKTPVSHLKSHQDLSDAMYIPILRKNNFIAPEIPFKLKKSPIWDYPTDPKKNNPKGLHKNIFRIDFEEIDTFILKNFPIDILSKTQSEFCDPNNNVAISDCIFFRKDMSVSLNISSYWEETLKKFPTWWEEKQSVKKSLEALYKNLLHSITSPYSRYHVHSLLLSLKKIKKEILNQITSFLSTNENIEILWVGENFIIAKYPENTSKDSIEKIVTETSFFVKKQISTIYNLNTQEIKKKIVFFPHFFFLGTSQNEKIKQPFLYAMQDDSTNIFFQPTFEKTSIELLQRICTIFLTDIFQNNSLEVSLETVLKNLHAGTLDEYLIYTTKLGKDYTKHYPENSPNIPHPVIVGKQLGIKRPGYTIKYVVTTSGPQSHNAQAHQLNHKYYEEKYVLPVYKLLKFALEDPHNSSSHEQMGFFD